MTTEHTRGEEDLPDFLCADGVEPVPRPRRPQDAKASNRHVPGEAGFWIFILGDMTLFGAILLVFMWESRSARDVFATSSSDLFQSIGAVNTLILLLSSYFVVLAVDRHRQGEYLVTRRLIAAAILCALAFAGLKAVEYSGEVAAGHTPASGLFFTFYFVLTGLHLLHVMVGAVLLTVWARKATRHDAWMPARRLIECVAVYWHMVDLLWIAIFTLVYLVGIE